MIEFCHPTNAGISTVKLNSNNNKKEHTNNNEETHEKKIHTFSRNQQLKFIAPLEDFSQLFFVSLFLSIAEIAQLFSKYMLFCLARASEYILLFHYK